MKLAIVGTAGRKDDAAKLTIEKWKEMQAMALSFALQHDAQELISGGAAVSDHLAVRLYINGSVPNLTLALPCEFDMEKVQFKEDAFDRTGATSNYYHRKMSKFNATNTLAEIKLAIEMGAKVELGRGFHDRNTYIAQHCNAILAYTFGFGAKLKDGGTLDTMKKFLKCASAKDSYHCDLHVMKLFNPAEVI